METVGLKNSDLMKVELNMSVYGIGYGITHYFDHKLLDSLPQEILREVLETELCGKLLDEIVRVYEFVRERRGFDPRPRKKTKGPREVTDVCAENPEYKEW